MKCTNKIEQLFWLYCQQTQSNVILMIKTFQTRTPARHTIRSTITMEKKYFPSAPHIQRINGLLHFPQNIYSLLVLTLFYKFSISKWTSICWSENRLFILEYSPLWKAKNMTFPARRRNRVSQMILKTNTSTEERAIEWGLGMVCRGGEGNKSQFFLFYFQFSWKNFLNTKFESL